jgi:hypothetical protein
VSEQRVLPHDLDAEQSVLGAILIDNSVFALAAAVVGAGDFFRQSHQRVFTCITGLLERGAEADLITVKESLERNGLLDDVGGPAYLGSLVDGVPRSTNVEHYARIVKEKAGQRALISSGNQLIARAYAEELPAGQLAVEASAELSLLANDRAAASPHPRLIADELSKERARREARRRLDAEDRGATSEPEILTLRERGGRPREAVRFRIDGWQPCDSRVILPAQYKAGKTTLVGSLVRSLVDGDPFLGVARVTPVVGTVAILDLEMGANQLDDWLLAQGIENDDRVFPIPLRGRAASLDILDPSVRQQWAARFRDLAVSYLVLDCLRPLLDVLGLDEHRDAGRFLVAFDALLAEAGIREALVVHHMGHSNERSRGDSRLRDWPDVEWRYVREDDNPRSRRFISGYGRDVNVEESAVDFDEVTRRLVISGGSRKDAAADAALTELLDILGDNELSGRAIETACREAGSTLTRQDVRAALQTGIRSNSLVTREGDKRAILHRRGPTALARGSAPEVRQTTASVCAAPFMGARTRALDGSPSSAPIRALKGGRYAIG